MTDTTIRVPPLTDLRFEPDEGDVTRVTTHEPTPVQPPRADPHVVSRVQGGPGAGFPSADDFYPSAAIFHGEQGAATVRACVDGQVRLTAEPTIIKSTGSQRLDEGAVRRPCAR